MQSSHTFLARTAVSDTQQGGALAYHCSVFRRQIKGSECFLCCIIVALRLVPFTFFHESVGNLQYPARPFGVLRFLRRHNFIHHRLHLGKKAAAREFAELLPQEFAASFIAAARGEFISMLLHRGDQAIIGSIRETQRIGYAGN